MLHRQFLHALWVPGDDVIAVSRRHCDDLGVVSEIICNCRSGGILAQNIYIEKTGRN